MYYVADASTRSAALRMDEMINEVSASDAEHNDEVRLRFTEV